jgi:hypothetical protein
LGDAEAYLSPQFIVANVLGRSTDLGVAIVDRDMLMSAMAKTLYERYNSQFPQNGRTAATAAFKSVPIDL